MCRWWHSSISVTHPHDPCAGGGTLLHLSLIPMIRVQVVALFHICHSSPWSVCRWWHSSASVTFIPMTHVHCAGGGTLLYLSLIPMIRVQVVALFYICHSSPWSVCRWWHSSISVTFIPMTHVQVVALFYMSHSFIWPMSRWWHSSASVTFIPMTHVQVVALLYLSLIPMIRVQVVALFYICHIHSYDPCAGGGTLL